MLELGIPKHCLVQKGGGERGLQTSFVANGGGHHLSLESYYLHRHRITFVRFREQGWYRDIPVDKIDSIVSDPKRIQPGKNGLGRFVTFDLLRRDDSEKTAPVPSDAAKPHAEYLELAPSQPTNIKFETLCRRALARGDTEIVVNVRNRTIRRLS